MTTLPLARALRIIDAAFTHAAAAGLKPLTVAVLDAGGRLIALQRQDGSSNLRSDIAIAKASGALDLGVSSRKIGEMAAERPTFANALASLAPAGLVPAAGGIILEDDEGRVLGAVGVTGDLSDQDEACAIAGAKAAGLQVRS